MLTKKIKVRLGNFYIAPLPTKLACIPFLDWPLYRALVYLLLDLEIILTFPFALSEYVNDIYGLTIALLFIIIITIGFVLGKSIKNR